MFLFFLESTLLVSSMAHRIAVSRNLALWGEVRQLTNKIRTKVGVRVCGKQRTHGVETESHANFFLFWST